MPNNHAEIEEDIAYKKFINKKPRSNETRKTILRSLKIYFNYIRMTPSEAIKEAKEEQISYLNDKNQIIEPDVEETKLAQYFQGFYEYERERGMSKNTIINRLATIRNFYNSLKLKKLPDNLVVDVPTSKKIPLRYEKIKRALSIVSPRDKAIISFMCSSGMRSGDVRSLKIKDFLKAVDIDNLEELLTTEEELIGYWKFTPHKTPRNKCQTCNSPYASRNIINYLLDRKKDKKINKNSILFSSKRTDEKYTRSGFSKKYNPLDEKLYYDDINWINKQAINKNWPEDKINEKKNNISKFHPHNFRTFFISTISSHSSNLRILSMMAGHKLPGQNDDTYVWFEKETIINTYFKMIPYLSFDKTITKKIDDKGRKKLKKLEQENKYLKERQRETNNRLTQIESTLQNIDYSKLDQLLNQE